MKNFLIYISIVILLFACKKKEPLVEDTCKSDDPKLNEFVYGIYDYWYLWNDKIPELSYCDYKTVDELADVMKYRDKDKWSFIIDSTTYNSEFVEGEYLGFGFDVMFDEYYRLMIINVNKGTTAYKKGIRRGMEITKVNGAVIQAIPDLADVFYGSDSRIYTLTIVNTDNNVFEIQLTKESYKEDAVNMRKIIDINGLRTGYIAFHGFTDYNQDSVMKVLSEFKENGIEDLVIDLRYNTGGLVDMTRMISASILSIEEKEKTFLNIKHNKDRSEEFDVSYPFEESKFYLNLNRVFFLTSEFSASASELLIISLMPFTEVKIIGTPTHGKPVGMYIFPFHGKYIAPITFANYNAEGFGDYFDGIDPDFYLNDDMNKELGDTTELLLNAAVHYIRTGSFPNIPIALKNGNSNTYGMKNSVFMKTPLAIIKKYRH